MTRWMVDLAVPTTRITAASAGVSVNLGVSTAQNTVGAGTDTLTNIDVISAFADTLTGTTIAYGTDYFVGGAGADTLDGGVDTGL